MLLRTGRPEINIATLLLQVGDSVVVIVLPVPWIDLLSVRPHQTLFPAHFPIIITITAFDVRGRRRGALIGRILPMSVLVERLVSIADLVVLEGDSPRRLVRIGRTVRRGRLVRVRRVGGGISRV